MKNLIIIPVYNEDKYIERVLKKVKKNTSSDILVINDGSTDKSLEIIDSLIPPHPPLEKGGIGVSPFKKGGLRGIFSITHPENQGYGKSLIDGFKFTVYHNYHYAVTIDCDEQHEPHLISAFLEEIKRFDIVSGSRYLEEYSANNPPPLDRRQINKEITKIINQITGYNLTDSFCGFKAYKVDSLRKLKLTEWGYGMPLQLWIQARQANLTIKEYPIGRIYKNLDRSFGNELDDPKKRLAYYKRIIKTELATDLHRL